MSDAHKHKRIRCHGPVAGPDGDCGTELNYADHGRYVKRPRGRDLRDQDLRDRFEQSALRFDCPDCGATLWTCPVCSDHLDPSVDGAHTAPGWYYGDSTGDALPCHNCNREEVVRQRQTGGGRTRRL